MKVISKKDLFLDSVDKFLGTFNKLIKLDIEKGIYLDFEIDSKTKSQKISPILKLANKDDAHIIVEICLDAYESTYPYKEFEHEQFVCEMLENPNYQIILFKNEADKYMGLFMCLLNFEEKKAYMGSFMIKKEYQRKVDIVKAIIGSYIWMWSTYKNKIALWYCENRTAHATAQYITSVCGIKTVAILPNKDIFFNKIESDVLGVIYNDMTLSKLRRTDFPKIIPEINNCFLYSNRRFNLGPVEFNNQDVQLNKERLNQLRERLCVKKETDKVGYEQIVFYFGNSDSYFKFIHTPWLQNFEKTEYKVNLIEELAIFIEKMQSLANQSHIRYVELYVSAYEPLHQKLFYDNRFYPRGYVPCWKYNKILNAFEDYIVFNSFKGEIKNLILLPEGLELLEILNLGLD